MFKQLLLVAVLLTVLAQVGCRAPAAVRADVQEDPVYYTQVGMWADRGVLVWDVNYRVGTHIPVNTVVRVNEVAHDLIGFSCQTLGGATVKLINRPRQTRLGLRELFERTFGREKVDLSALSEATRQAVLDGEIRPGMSREAVLAARGFPPAHKTPTLDADEWRYLSSKVRTSVVRFDEEGFVIEVLPKPLPTEAAPKAPGEVPVHRVPPAAEPPAPRPPRVRGVSVELQHSITEDPVFVTQVGMWIDRGNRIIATNYRGSEHVPVNTEVAIRAVSRRRIVFTCSALGGQPVQLVNSAYTRIGIEDLFERTFGREPVDLSGMDAALREPLEAGDVRVGMTRGQVIACRGYPPAHRTPDLAAEQWVYWRSRFRKTLVRFGEDGRVTEITPKPEDPADPGDPGDADDLDDVEDTAEDAGDE